MTSVFVLDSTRVLCVALSYRNSHVPQDHSHYLLRSPLLPVSTFLPWVSTHGGTPSVLSNKVLGEWSFGCTSRSIDSEDRYLIPQCGQTHFLYFVHTVLLRHQWLCVNRLYNQVTDSIPSSTITVVPSLLGKFFDFHLFYSLGPSYRVNSIGDS